MEAQNWSTSKMVAGHILEETQHGCWTAITQEALISHVKHKAWSRQRFSYALQISFCPTCTVLLKKSHLEITI